ncbi:3-methyladenine DNA glycosylase AlkD [Microbacteriaceae bacterium MWH-Ta3]|nr:3-methyladenine DNA glycosylase AlkD [Microbacteriaceae bacterium MWH-Ta3]
MASIENDIRALANPERAVQSQRYFKTGPGEYGEGDTFVGLTVPQTRTVARRHRDASRTDILAAANSPIHEVRLCALHILVDQFRRARVAADRASILNDLLQLIADNRVNNWDLIDSSAPYIGAAVFERPDPLVLLNSLAASPSLWERRAAIMFTAAAIRLGNFAPTLHISVALLNDTHDLIHKATGWMLREVGKKDIAALRTFLGNHATTMPRTMLRYAIEKLPPSERAHWLAARGQTKGAPPEGDAPI